MMRGVPRLIVLRGPTPALRARPELTPRAEDLLLTPAGELPWEGVRRLVAALAAIDRERVAEALFEAAWSMYEGGDHDTAIDLLERTDNVDGSLRVGQHAVAVFGVQLRDAKVEVLRQLIPEEGNAP